MNEQLQLSGWIAEEEFRAGLALLGGKVRLAVVLLDNVRVLKRELRERLEGGIDGRQTENA